jgi:hypothetical protein
MPALEVVMGRIGPLAALALLAIPLPLQAQDAFGQVCIAPADPPAPGQKSLRNPAAGNRVRQYTVQIDSLPPVAVSTQTTQLVKDIPTAGAHWVRIKGDGKPVASFKFKFSDFPSSQLCLFFNELYESWNLWDSKQAKSICKCK